MRRLLDQLLALEHSILKGTLTFHGCALRQRASSKGGSQNGRREDEGKTNHKPVHLRSWMGLSAASPPPAASPGVSFQPKAMFIPTSVPTSWWKDSRKPESPEMTRTVSRETAILRTLELGPGEMDRWSKTEEALHCLGFIMDSSCFCFKTNSRFLVL